MLRMCLHCLQPFELESEEEIFCSEECCRFYMDELIAVQEDVECFEECGS